MHIRFTVELLALAGTLLAAPFTNAQKDDWQAVKSLAPGQQIQVSLQSGGSRKGILQDVSDSALTLNTGTIQMQDIRRVLAKGHGHRVRNTLIGAGIGAGVGLGLGASIDSDCSTTSLICTGNKGKAIGTPLFAVLGAGVGAVLPAHAWKEVYRKK
jgi:hypothetical protein